MLAVAREDVIAPNTLNLLQRGTSSRWGQQHLVVKHGWYPANQMAANQMNFKSHCCLEGASDLKRGFLGSTEETERNSSKGWDLKGRYWKTALVKESLARRLIGRDP